MHTEEAVRSSIICSVRDGARELVGFVGFQADLSHIPDWVEAGFGKVPTVDKLQQEFNQLQQERDEKYSICL